MDTQRINIRKQVIKLTLQRLAKIICLIMVSAGLIVGVAPGLSQATDDVPRMTIQELKAKMERGEKIIILDVRSGDDYAKSSVKITGAIRIPLDQLEKRYKELSEGIEIIAYCAWHDEATSARAARKLLDKGFKQVVVGMHGKMPSIPRNQSK